MNMDLQSDRHLVRTRGRSIRYTFLTFTAPEAPRAAQRRPLNVAFVLVYSYRQWQQDPDRQTPAGTTPAGTSSGGAGGGDGTEVR